MRKILVVAPNWIGDALMAQPLFAQIKARHPRAQIHAIAPKWVAPVLARMPEIARVLPTDLAHGKLQLGSRTMFAQQLKNETFDAAYVLPNSFKSALIPWLAGIPLRIGYKGESRLGVLNVRYPNPPKNARPPMVQHYAALAFKPGAKLPDTLPDYPGPLAGVLAALEAVAAFLVALWLRERTFRLSALALLLGAVGRIVVLDVWRLDQQGRYLAFIGLGLALLAVSFLYSRYRTRLQEFL